MITRDSKDILVADDSLFFRTKLSDVLIEAGHRVRFARDGREVIREIEADPDHLDLLMLDLQMPEVDGFGVLRWINENGFRDRFPVLAITGVYEPATVMERIRGQGASGLMSKDLSPEQIIFRVNRLLFQNKAEKGARPRTRVPVSIPVDFNVGEHVQTGFLLNISETGVYLHTKFELLSGALVNLRFSLPDAPGRIYDVKGLVRWTTSDIAKKTLFGGGGIMFTTISPEDQEDIKAFVEKEAKAQGLVD